jgi:hypothetical protein
MKPSVKVVAVRWYTLATSVTIVIKSLVYNAMNPFLTGSVVLIFVKDVKRVYLPSLNQKNEAKLIDASC